MELIDPLPFLSLPEWGSLTPGLERVNHVLGLLGRPEHQFPHILVGGTNGKTTVSYNLAAGLPGRVGLFTSPHLVDVRERILIDGAWLPDQGWRRAHDAIQATRPPKLSFFEWMLLISVVAFAEQRVDWAVLEVGLGGRWDATNALDPVMSVITNVSLDHTELLGDNTTAIALEKIEIARRDRPLFLPRWVGDIPRVALRLNQIGCQVTVRPDPPQQPSPRANRAIVDQVLKHLFITRHPSQWTKVRGRRQILQLASGATIFLDGAHNEAGWDDLAMWIDTELPHPLNILCGLTAGRDPASFLTRIKPFAKQVMVWRSGHERELAPEAWAHLDVLVRDRVDLKLAPLLVCGSLYTVGAFMHQYRNQLTESG